MRILLCLCLVWSAFARSVAVTYDYDPDSFRKLPLNVPDGTTDVRGILIVGNGAGGDSRGSATNTELVAFARRIGFVVLATGFWGNFADSGSEFRLFESSLDYYANLTGYAELSVAPWLPMGHSNGGQMSYGLNVLRPEKVIGFITSKGCCYNNFLPDIEALRTPGMLIAGENDTQFRRDNIKRLFDLNRPRGALWSWVEEENTGHEEANSQQLKLSFLAECYRLRYPRDQSPRDGPVQLKRLNEWEGWLADQTTWNSGFTAIYRYDQFSGDPRSIGWVPTERIAHLYRSFSSYNRLTSIITGNAGNPVTAPATLTYRVDLTGKSWEKVEFYEGATKLSEATPAEGSLPQISLPVQTGGLYTFHAVVTVSGEAKSPTMLRHAFVTGPAALTPFETWAALNFPSDQRARSSTPLNDGIPNVVRWAFGLSSPAMSERSRLPVPVGAAELINGVPYRVFQYTTETAARDADASFTALLSEDLVDWTPAENNPAAGVVVERTGDLIRVKALPLSTLFLKVAVDDPCRGERPRERVRSRFQLATPLVS